MLEAGGGAPSVRWCEILGTRPSVARMGVLSFDLDLGLELDSDPRTPKGQTEPDRKEKPGQEDQAHEFSSRIPRVG